MWITLETRTAQGLEADGNPVDGWVMYTDGWAMYLKRWVMYSKRWVMYLLMLDF